MAQILKWHWRQTFEEGVKHFALETAPLLAVNLLAPGHPATPVGPSWRDKMSAHCKKQWLGRMLTQHYFTELCSSATWSHQRTLQPGAPKTPIPRGDPSKQLREQSHAAEQHLADISHTSFYPVFPYSMTMTAQGKSSHCNRKDNWKIKSFLSPSPSHISCT